MKLFGVPSLILTAFVVATAYMYKKPPSYMPWHNNKRWERLLNIYDKIAAVQYDGCDSKLIDTKFGKTQVHACGNPENPPLFLLHGAGSNALIYGEWLVPELVNSHYAVAVDYLCDVGRSSPKDMNPENCPATEQDIAEWVQQVAQQLSLSTPVSLLGYSFGSLMSFLVALHKPQLVDKLVLIAPAAVFAPIEPTWIWRAIVYGVTRTQTLHNWFFQFMSAEEGFHMNQMEPDDWELTDAIRDVGGTILNIQADSFEDNILKKVIDDHPTFLLIGKNETVINGTLAAARANAAGATVRVYENAGHLLLMEEPSVQAARDVANFMSTVS